MDIRYLGGSGFLVSLGTTGLLFDASDLGEFPGTLPTRQELAAFTRLYIFISQTEEDHFSPRLRDLAPSRAEFITSSDFPEEARHRLAAGESLTLDDLTVTAYDSTDQGVAFLAETAGVRIFHAGSLNLWHWRDISTLAEIEAAEKDFNTCLAAIPKNTIDLAFFPVDPRQGSMFDAGAGAFLMTVKPKLLIPMHFQDRSDAARYFASTNETNATRISVLEKAGDVLSVSFPDEQDPDEPLPIQLPPLPSGESPEEGDGGQCPQAGTGGSPSSPNPAQQASTGADSEAPLPQTPQPDTDLAASSPIPAQQASTGADSEVPLPQTPQPDTDPVPSSPIPAQQASPEADSEASLPQTPQPEQQSASVDTLPPENASVDGTPSEA